MNNKTEQAVTDALPERDTTKTAEQQGLFRKFDVRRVDGSDQLGGKHHGCRYYVLDVDHDPYAAAALGAYADACRESHPELARDLREKWGAADTINTLHAQLAEAKKDSERLDWIEKIALRELPSPPRRGMWKFGDGLIVGMSLRAAIDAAIGESDERA